MLSEMIFRGHGDRKLIESRKPKTREESNYEQLSYLKNGNNTACKVHHRCISKSPSIGFTSLKNRKLHQ
jgi:hypothetical protein